MSDRVARHDWASTPLGPREAWPEALRAAVDLCLGSRFPMFVWWGPERINLYNDAYAPVLGARHPAALGRRAAEVWSEIWDVIGPQADAVLLRGEATWNDRVPLLMERHGFPEQTWFTWSYSPIRDVAGNIAGMFCACTEETGRVRAEERVASILESITDGFYAVDHAWRFTYVNAEAERLLGASRDELLGRELWEMFPGAGLSEIGPHYRKVMADRAPTSFEAFYAPWQRWFDIKAFPTADGGLTAYFNDVTARRRADDEIRASELRFQAFMDHSPASAWITDAAGTVLYVSKTYLETFDSGGRSPVGLGPHEFAPREIADEWIRNTRVVVRSGRPLETMEPSIRADGTLGEFLVYKFPLPAEPGGTINVGGVAVDVTALLEAEQRLDLAIAAADLGTWEWDAGTDEMSLSARCAQIYGVEPGQKVVRTTMRELLDPADRAMAAEANERAVATHGDYDVEYTVVRPRTGERARVAVRGRAEYDPTGRPLRMRGVAQDVTERHRRDCALQEQAATLRGQAAALGEQARRLTEANDLLRGIADGTQELIAAVDPDLRFTFVNAAYQREFERVFGAPAVPGASLAGSLAHAPEERDRTVAMWRRALSGETVDLTAEFGAPGRERRVYDLRFYPIRTTDGAIAGAGAIATDVTQRHRYEDAIRHSEQRFRFLSDLGESTRDLTDPESVMAVVARRLGEHLGASRCAYADVELDGDRYAIRHDHCAPGVASTVGHYRLDDFGARAAADQRSGRTLVLNDVDVELGAGTPDADARGIATFAAIGIQALVCCPLLKQGRLVAMMAVHQSTPRRWTDRELSLIEEVVERSWAYVERARATRERELLLEAEQMARADAERSYRDAEAASRSKDEFLATLGHELRTPLNAILGWSQIARRAGPTASAERVGEALAVIERNARAQARIIDDLLDMSRIISGKVRLEVRALDLASVIEAALDTVRPAADAKGVTLLPNLDAAGLAPVSGDASRLQQVFWNLLSNAVKFTPRGGRVSIRVDRSGPAGHAGGPAGLDVTIDDTGEGIDPAYLPHVFGRFSQADASTTRRHGGLGLGLSIVKQLVEMHGGTVRAHSAGQGQGARFVVSLPTLEASSSSSDTYPTAGPSLSDGVALGPGLAAPSAAGPAGAPVDLRPHANGARRLDGRVVLVVDDEPDARSLLQRVLEDRGARALIASSGEEAIALLHEGRADVIVSDIGMPGEDGYALMRRVRALPPDRGGATPALALTAYARPEDRAAALRAGYQMHLAKPIDPDEVVAAIERLI